MRPVEPPPFIPENTYTFEQILHELIEKRRFNEFLEIEESSYPYWEKWKYLAKDWDIDAKKLWSAVKINRRFGKEMLFTAEKDFVFNYRTPTLIQRYLHEFDLNLGGSLQGQGVIPSEDKDRYLISALMEEAIASSQIEGASTTHRIAKEMLEQGRKPRNTSEQMIANNYDAMSWIVKNKDLPFTSEAILKIHALLTKNTMPRPEQEGAYRTSNDINIIDVQTGRVIYTPPGYDLLSDLIYDFCNYANDEPKEGSFIHPILKAIFLHFLIGYIHPFNDGNGRTARTVFIGILLKRDIG